MTNSNQGLRLRTTIVIESENAKDLTNALQHAVDLAQARVMLMSFGPKKKGGASISVRTTRVRRQTSRKGT
jgi:hypothetical protein